MSFDEMRIKTICAAQNLQRRGYTPKQVFAFIGANSHNAAAIILASISIGCPVNTIHKKAEVMEMLKKTKPAAMFSDLVYYNFLKECLTELGNDATIFTFGGSKNDSEPVEVLFAETQEEDNFM